VKADLEYSCVLISIVKNLIQKMPLELLHQYPYPSNPELLLCLIENKKLEHSELSALNISQVDEQWSFILQSYTSFVYGLGSICDIRSLKMLNGVSLSPWIHSNCDMEVIKRLLAMLEDEEAEDEDYDDNTAQMLERLANEDEEDVDYYASDGGNYSYMYCSPYDCHRDSHLMVQKLVNMGIFRNRCSTLN
jgi:hypothetical protein